MVCHKRPCKCKNLLNCSVIATPAKGEGMKWYSPLTSSTNIAYYTSNSSLLMTLIESASSLLFPFQCFQLKYFQRNRKICWGTNTSHRWLGMSVVRAEKFRLCWKQRDAGCKVTWKSSNLPCSLIFSWELISFYYGKSLFPGRVPSSLFYSLWRLTKIVLI